MPFDNRVQIFEFDPDGPWFGQRGATIESVRLLDPDGNSVQVAQGGEEVVLKVSVRAERRLDGPIVGWLWKNRMGQSLFGDNTFVTYQFTPLVVGKGNLFHAKFRFQLPFLPSGDYALAVAVAEGTQASHVQHHWIDDALFVRVSTSHICHALIGVPMQEIALEVDA